jgi:hypothetical protein
MNKEKFLEAINKVGWKVQPSWNGLNDKLISPTGKETDIRVMTDSLEPYSNNLFGGESFQMSVKWFYKDAIFNEEENYVAIHHLLLMNNV